MPVNCLTFPLGVDATCLVPPRTLLTDMWVLCLSADWIVEQWGRQSLKTAVFFGGIHVEPDGLEELVVRTARGNVGVRTLLLLLGPVFIRGLTEEMQGKAIWVRIRGESRVRCKRTVFPIRVNLGRLGIECRCVSICNFGCMRFCVI